MQNHYTEYSSLRSILVRIITWNAGAAKPSDLDVTPADREFVRNALADDKTNPPHVIVFGFQEVVELDKTSVTAKTMLRSKRKKDIKNVAVSSHISHQYKAWQDRLCDEVGRALGVPYKLIHSDNMVGLLTCVFLLESELPHLRGIRSSAVKTGLGGLHGNKGGLVVRMLLDDSSICFVNSHLAAGQSGSLQRNKDIETILETQFLGESDNTKYTGKGIFVNGGDGTMILDHEIVFFSGDMNYRLNLLRPVAIKAIQESDYEKLIEADQLNIQFRKYPGLRLRPFSEPPIQFRPTYKYDIGTDDFDSSEKKRVPAWCDRIFYRGGDRVTPISYQSETVRVSDHRPVNGLFKVQVKNISGEKRTASYKACLSRWDSYLREKVDASNRITCMGA